MDLSEYRDEYQEELRRIIDAKVAGEEIVAPVEEAPAKLVNLMDALRKSLDTVSASRKKTLKVVPQSQPAARPAPKKKRA